MIKKKRISTWLIVAIVIIVSTGLIWLNNPFSRLAGQEKKLMASLIVVAICLGILLFDALFVWLWDRLISLSFIQKFKILTGVKPEQPAYEQNNNRHSEVVKEIRQYLRTIYNRNWGRKTRILLITGTAAEMEQLTPGLTSQLWQEDRGTLLLWGGDLNTSADSAWLSALRKLRRRPVDGLVWVTSAFDQLSAPGMEQPLPVPSEGTMDSLSHAISARMDTLGWKLPLYIWSLHPRGGKPEGRIVQAAGCLLPAGCRIEGLAGQLAALTPQLTCRGLQQICDEAQHNFLLMLADQLIRKPESLSGPLSVMLNPYRPLPLAACITLILAGCGLTQKVTDGTVAVTKSIFYKQIKTLHLDIRAREAVNSNAGGVALSTVVRIYQLKDRKTFDTTDYPSLFNYDSQAIRADLVAEKDIRLQPGGAVTVDMPMEEDAQYVAVAGMFMAPDQINNSWRVVLGRDALDPDKARVIEAGNNRLMLIPVKE